MSAQPLTLRSFSTAEYAEMLGISRQAVLDKADKKKWKEEKRKGQGGGKSWPFSSVDHDTQAKVALAVVSNPIFIQEPDPVVTAAREVFLAARWQDYESKPTSAKERAIYRYNLLFEAWQLHLEGVTLKQAFLLVSQKHNERVANLRNWYFGTGRKTGVRGIDPKDWLPFLVDQYQGRVSTAECTEDAWEWLKKDYLRREQPAFAMSYSRLENIAKEQDWTIPSERTLRRRLSVEFTPVVIEYMRTGSLKNTYPNQQRERDCFAAGEAVSGDGLKFDRLYVIWPDGEVSNQATGWFWEDINSGKILAYDLDKSENTDMFRRATHNLTGITLPRYAWVDNTRVAANKSMTGQAANRHRFTNKATDPVGIMKLMGIDVRFTNPDHDVSSPGAKPIERAFGIGGLHERMRTWPTFKGRGFSLNTAIPFEEFKEALAHVVVEHNAKTGRRGGICNGRSFDEVFAAGFALATVRRPSESLRKLLLHDQEVCTVSAQGSVLLNAGRGEGKHQYFADKLFTERGQKVAVMYNPDDLTLPVQIYDLQGSHICQADWMSSVAFRDKAAGREYAREKKRRNKHVKRAAASASRMNDYEHQQLNAVIPAGVIPEPGSTTILRSEQEVEQMLTPTVDKARQQELLEIMNRNIANMDNGLRRASA